MKCQRTSLATSTLSELMCGWLESCDIEDYGPSKALWSMGRGKLLGSPYKAEWNQQRVFDEWSGCTSKQEDVCWWISSNDESYENFYCS